MPAVRYLVIVKQCKIRMVQIFNQTLNSIKQQFVRTNRDWQFNRNDFKIELQWQLHDVSNEIN